MIYAILIGMDVETATNTVTMRFMRQDTNEAFTVQFSQSDLPIRFAAAAKAEGQAEALEDEAHGGTAQ